MPSITSRSIRKARHKTALVEHFAQIPGRWRSDGRPVLAKGCPPPARKSPLPKSGRSSWAKRRLRERARLAALALPTNAPEACPLSHEPNAETARAIEEARQGINVTPAPEATDGASPEHWVEASQEAPAATPKGGD